MAVGFILIGWIAGFVTALVASFGFGVGLLPAIGLFAGTSVTVAFTAILLMAWRTGCFDPIEAPPPRAAAPQL